MAFRSENCALRNEPAADSRAVAVVLTRLSSSGGRRSWLSIAHDERGRGLAENELQNAAAPVLRLPGSLDPYIHREPLGVGPNLELDLDRAPSPERLVGGTTTLARSYLGQSCRGSSTQSLQSRWGRPWWRLAGAASPPCAATGSVPHTGRRMSPLLSSRRHRARESASSSEVVSVPNRRGRHCNGSVTSYRRP
jgi:hypothetical protein